MVKVDPRLFNLVPVLDETAEGGGVVVGYVTNPRYDEAGNVVADITYLGTKIDGVRIHAAEIPFPKSAVPSEADSPVYDQRREVATWQETAGQAMRDRDFYRSIVTQIGEMFGDAAKTSDDGTVQQDVLALKVPECVRRLQAEIDAARQEAFRYGFKLDCDDSDPAEVAQADELISLVSWIAQAESQARAERDEALCRLRELQLRFVPYEGRGGVSNQLPGPVGGT
jgi:hypothetical protein